MHFKLEQFLKERKNQRSTLGSRDLMGIPPENDDTLPPLWREKLPLVRKQLGLKRRSRK